MYLAALLSLPLTVLAQPQAQSTLVIDGIANEAAWANAQIFDDFKVVQPYTLQAPLHPTRVRIMGTPEGIAVAFHNEHPASTERRAERTARDADSDGDRVNLYVDFDGDAKVGYNFMVTLAGALQDSTITNERSFSRDWDGQWQGAAVDHGDHWTAEMLIPWSTASMAGSATAKREIAVMFDRVIGATQERSGWPYASYTRPRYLSEFSRIEIDQFQQASFSWFPYASVLSDQVNERLETKFGLDLLWKPSGDFQLTAALNPDFGQVEADELVVNFDAVEVFFSDRRPFFTENQGLFDVRTPDSGLLVYTRRIGGPRDDQPDRAADIDAAVKVNGRFAGTDYGVLTAFERDYADDQTGAYLVNRLQRSVGNLQLGYLGTFADRPALDRQALVQGVDLNWRPNAQWLISGQILGSSVDQQRDSTDGKGAWVRAFHTPNPQWQQELEITHFDDQLNFNDLGFQRRASLNEVEYTLSRRYNDFAAGDARRSVLWALEPQWRSNDRGDRLPAVMQVRREAEFVDGGFSYATINAASSGFDDLISRGNGLVKLPQRMQYAEYFKRLPRRGDWVVAGGVYSQQDGLEDYALGVFSELRWLPREDLNAELDVSVLRSPDWLIWQQEDQFGGFDRRLLEASLDLNWFPAPTHEIRAKLQWLGLRASDAIAYRISDSAHLVASGETLDDFSINTLGLQLRYRWQFAPASDLYVVYSRGGFEERQQDRDELGEMFRRSFDLRDADQFLVKLRYGF
jgi:hypothetical protein